jgi:acyl carrier protein
MTTPRSVLIEELSAVAKVNLDHLDDAAVIRGDLPIDSLALLEVFVRVEERLGIELDEETLSNARTIGDLVACIAASAGPEERS